MAKFVQCCAIATQVVLIAILVFAARETTFLIVVDFYYPTIFVITQLGRFTGESTMMLPVFFGVPLGILLYGIAFALLIATFKKRGGPS
jgi:hypothetical protein